MDIMDFTTDNVFVIDDNFYAFECLVYEKLITLNIN